MTLSINRTGCDGGYLLPPSGRNICDSSTPESVEWDAPKLTMIRTPWGPIPVQQQFSVSETLGSTP